MFCAIFETFIFVQRDKNDLPGDYGIGYWGIRNIGFHEQELIIELEHGRLCMISFIVALFLEYTSSPTTHQQPWTEQPWIQPFIGS